jgi:hypothetical protein
MMDAIRVGLKVPTERGRLYPRYDPEANLLEVGTNLPRKCPFGVDVDGSVIFDIDENRILANFDLLIPRSLWEVVRFLPAYSPARSADLEFSEETLRIKSFHLPLAVHTTEDRMQAQILLGPTSNALVVVGLSDSCLALLNGDRLVGFRVSLKRRRAV